MGTEKASGGTGVFLAHLVVLVVLCVTFTLMYLAYVDMQALKADTYYERRENRKLRDEMLKLKQELEKLKS